MFFHDNRTPETKEPETTTTVTPTDDDRKARIQPLIDQWGPELGLTDWEIKWTLVDSIGTTYDNSPSAAQVSITGPYQTATLVFCRKQIDIHEPRELEILIIHELLHIVIRPLVVILEDYVGRDGKIRDAMLAGEETLADKLATIIYRLYYETDNEGGYYIHALTAEQLKALKE